jgi:ABC-type antimicrobial peptide transport system permease subunit
MEDNGSRGPREVEVVGVVRSMRETALDQPPTPIVYVPIWQVPNDLGRFLTNNFFWIMRTNAPLGTQLRQQIAAVDADAAMVESPMDQYMDRALGKQRFSLRILLTFAVAALLLAASGLYALVSYATAQRTREMGIRLAMGARLCNVAGLVVRQALGLAVGGVVLGTAGAWAAAKLIAPLLFEVSPHDALTLWVAAVALIVVAAGASYAPARRAGRVDPVIALRRD